jgi:hypothetical protein
MANLEGSKVIEVEIVNPSTKVTKENSDLKQFFFHPSTVLVMMGLDWGGLLLEIPQTLAPILLFLTAIFIFGVAFALSYHFQKNVAGDSKSNAVIKSLIAAAICAIPFPIMSTGIGTIILGLSGMNAIGEKGLPGLIEMFKKKD